jgi:hypothetical protein
MLSGSLVTTAWHVLVFADGGDSLQVWKVSVNVLNKQLRTADKGWSSNMGDGRVANNPSPYKISLLRSITKDLGQIFRTNDLNYGICIALAQDRDKLEASCQHGNKLLGSIKC